MRRTAATMVTACLLVLATAACETRTQDEDPAPEATASPTAPVDVSEYESGPQSTIAFGLEVPSGAAQLGPLVRIRSERLIAAYQPELDAAEAQREAAEEERRQEAEEAGEPTPVDPPTPSTQPEQDTFALVEDPPRPDTAISVMRLDGSPTAALRLMVGQMNAVIPGAGLPNDDIGEYCEATVRRITGCRVQARGETTGGQDIRITVTVDPGDVDTRTGRASSQSRPVMTATVEHVGDPRSGQIEREDEDVDVPREVEGQDRSDLIWPKMDEDAPALQGLPGDWEMPLAGTTLLSGVSPTFVAIATDRPRQADRVAESFATAVGEPTVDVIEDLNEITTTYSSVDDQGNVAVASYVLSARGNYAMLFYTPEGSTGPGAEGGIEPLEPAER
ncbi:hypothetical protein ACHAAC_10705 [Aeromicrobium sp. CF4.19]|uniref:hypothetical protein n=1 Tax=Aeromicrobium sp. CF4.19 TaxID=3373082 RepID=UPI003EE42736